MIRVEDSGEVIAIIIDVNSDFKEGTQFISDQHWPLQLGLLAHTSGHVIPAHLHLEREAKARCQTQEFLFVLAGKVEVDFYSSSGDRIQTETLISGQALLQILGGHGFRFLEASRILEVKLGPYLGKERDKQLIQSSLIGRN